MEMAESTQAGVEHVERTGVDQVGNNVDAASGSGPPARRTTRTSHSRPRPMSMPPAANPDAPPAQQAQDQTHHAHESRSQAHSSTRRGGSRATVRVIGNYSLGKTLGAGSMGKVKLAYQNQTGEKVSTTTRRAARTTLIHPATAGYQNCSKAQRVSLQPGEPHGVIPGETGRKGRFEGDSNRQRGRIVYDSLPSVHLRYTRDHCAAKLPLHRLRVCQRRPDARLYHQSRPTTRTCRTQIRSTDWLRTRVLPQQ